MDVLAARSPLGPSLPGRVVETLVTATSVPIAIVEKARLPLGEYRISLRQLAEPRLGIGIVRNVGVELSSEAMEGPLDGVFIGIPRNAEHLVIVALQGAHRPYCSLPAPARNHFRPIRVM
jgi:hypothetical protein